MVEAFEATNAVIAMFMKGALQIGLGAAFGTYVGCRGWPVRHFFVGMSVLIPLSWLILWRWLP